MQKTIKNSMSKGIKKILVLLLIILIIPVVILKYPKPEEKMRVPEGYHKKITLTSDVTINFVFVGFEENIIQPDIVLESLPRENTPTDWGRGNVFELPFEYLHYNLSYKFIFAPDGFANKLFNYSNSIAEFGPPTDYLINYDEESGQNRLEEGEQIQYVNVTAVEDWINVNRAKYNLMFKEPEYTLFFFDSYTKGYMPTDTYHYWKFYEERYRPEEMVIDMQAWGGNYGFLWLDVGAAPSEYRNEDSAEAYPPIWEYDENTWDEFNEILSTVASFAVQYRFLPSYIYHPVNRPVYISSHIWVDDRSLITSDFEKKVNFEECLERLRSYMPWLGWQGSHKTFYLPDDDPGMDETLRKARFKEGKTVYIDSKPVMNYITRNRGKYDRSPETFQNIWVNLFVLQGVQGFEGPMTYGIAAGAPDGKGWGVLGTVNDLVEYEYTVERCAEWFHTLLVHEPGHILGLHHPHDGMINENGTTKEGPVYWLWDQSATIMSYRITPWGGDQLDRDNLARAHTKLNIHESYKNLDTVYENLRAENREWITDELFKRVTATENNIKKAVNCFRSGDWLQAATLSYNALGYSQKALNISGGVDYKTREISWIDTFSHAQVDPNLPGWAEYQTNPYHVYKEIIIERGSEYAVVEVSWDNGFTSAADLFVGWNFNDTSSGAVFDLEEEQRIERSNSMERIVINFDDDGIRESGRIYAGMGFYRGAAVNLEYNVKITIYSRMNS